jgi:hypothetical protein
VLDADETSSATSSTKSNGPGAAHTRSWLAWVGREATPLPGAAAFLSRVRDLGGRIAIVTNRLESQCADTEAVFKTHHLAYDIMLCRPDGGPSDKNPRFAAVAAGTVDRRRAARNRCVCRRQHPGLSESSQAAAGTSALAFGISSFLLPNPMAAGNSDDRPRISVFPKCYFDELVDGRRNYVEWIRDAATLGAEGVEHYDGFFPSYDERTSRRSWTRWPPPVKSRR